MAAAAIQLAVLEGVKVVHRSSDALSPIFAAVGVGTITLSDNGGVLDLGGASLGNLALAQANIFVGSSGGIATPVAVSGHVTIDDAGLVLIVAGAVDTAELADGAVVTGKLSPGLQTEISDHETRIIDAESEILQLQSAVQQLQGNTPVQETQTSIGGQTLVTLSSLTFDADNTILDIEVTVDGRVQTQDTAGGATESYVKSSGNQLTFSEALPAGKRIRVLKRGTSSGPAINYSTPTYDLQAIVVAPAPAVNGDKSLGTTVNAWKSLFLKDTATSQVYELNITNGEISFDPV